MATNRIFNFFFVPNFLNINKERGFIEIDIENDSLASNGILFSPTEFQETRFQKLVLPINSQTQKELLQNNIVGKRMVIKHIKSEPTLANLDEQTLTVDTFGTIETVNKKNENPFDPLEPDWDHILKWKEGWKSWRVWWNPRNMKFWAPELTPREQEKFTKDDKLGRAAAQKVYEDRLNQQNRQFNLYFSVNATDKYHSRSSNPDQTWSDNWEIRIFCWPPLIPPSAIEELIPNDSDRRKEFIETVIGEIDLLFDNQDEKNMQLFQQWNNLLKEVSPNQKFVIRNIPLQIRKRTIYNLDNFRDFDKYNWQAWNEKSELENELPQWRKHKWGLSRDEAIFQGKLVQRMVINTKEWKNLKLEKVSEEEYHEKYEIPNKLPKNRNYPRKQSNFEKLKLPLTIGLTAAASISFIIFFIKVRKTGKKLK